MDPRKGIDRSPRDPSGYQKRIDSLAYQNRINSGPMDPCRVYKNQMIGIPRIPARALQLGRLKKLLAHGKKKT